MTIHVKVVNLVVDGVNDDEKSLSWIIRRHLREVGPETSLHFTRYFPAFKFDIAPTSAQILEKACKMAKVDGVLYSYIGNALEHPHKNTYCPPCMEKLILRHGSNMVGYRLTEDKSAQNAVNPSLSSVGMLGKKRLFPIT